MKKNKKKILIIAGDIFVLMIAVFVIWESCKVMNEGKNIQTVIIPSVTGGTESGQNKVTETPLPTPTNTPVPTPTNTPVPTPTNTPVPTPTNTPLPTPTNMPTPTPTNTPTPTPSPTPTAEELREQTRQEVLENIENGVYSELDNKKYAWWFRRKKDHTPSGSGESFNIDNYDGYYRNKEVATDDKVIYITLDCGYGSANTKTMLEIFKKHDVKITFFVTEYFIKANPEQVLMMLEDGHMVGNHTVSHKNLPDLTEQQIYDEIVGCEEAFYEATGQQIDMYFRPPEGAYSKRVMQMIQDLGYKTMFWSIAYDDYSNNPMNAEEVLEHFETYHHNGALALMHNDSKGNMKAMDNLLTYLKEQGYRFGTLDEMGAAKSENNLQ